MSDSSGIAQNQHHEGFMFFVIDESKASRDYVCMVLESRLRISPSNLKDYDGFNALLILSKYQPTAILVREKTLGVNAELLAMIRAHAVPMVVIHDVQPGEFEVENVAGAVVHVERPIEPEKVEEALAVLLSAEVLESMIPQRIKALT